MPRTFRQLLANTLMTGVTSTFLWFALTFWVYIETRSVVATGVIGGAFSLSSAALGPFFGTYVDRHRKATALVLTTTAALVCFLVAGAVYISVDAADLLRLTNPWFWVLVGATLLGSVAGQMRSIVLSTCVTLLVPDALRPWATSAAIPGGAPLGSYPQPRSSPANPSAPLAPPGGVPSPRSPGQSAR